VADGRHFEKSQTTDEKRARTDGRMAYDVSDDGSKYPREQCTAAPAAAWPYSPVLYCMDESVVNLYTCT